MQQGREQLNWWVHELKDRKPDDFRLTPVAKAATVGIQAYFMDLLHERRARPRTDLVTHIVTAEIDGVPFAEEDFGPASEVLGPMMALFLAGWTAPAGPIGTLFKLLAENPDQRAILRENPALITDAVEEAIRLATPLQLVGRTTSRRGHAGRSDVPGRRPGGAGLRRGEPRRAAVHRPGPLRCEGRDGSATSGSAKECTAASVRRWPGSRRRWLWRRGFPRWATTQSQAPPERYRTTPNMYVWDHLHLAFPVARPRSTTRNVETVWRDSPA